MTPCRPYLLVSRARATDLETLYKAGTGLKCLVVPRHGAPTFSRGIGAVLETAPKQKFARAPAPPPTGGPVYGVWHTGKTAASFRSPALSYVVEPWMDRALDLAGMLNRGTALLLNPPQGWHTIFLAQWTVPTLAHVLPAKLKVQLPR